MNKQPNHVGLIYHVPFSWPTTDVTVVRNELRTLRGSQ